MSIELVSYSEFESHDLARQLHKSVNSSLPLLARRNIGGKMELATRMVEKGQREHIAGTLGYFAVVGSTGNVIGAASIYPNLKLRRLGLAIPPVMAIGRLAYEHHHVTPNIHGWIREGEDGLRETYAQLLKTSKLSEYRRSRENGLVYCSLTPNYAWAIEPKDSPPDIHQAISAAPLQAIQTRRFDDGESRWRIPPLATLYVEVPN